MSSWVSPLRAANGDGLICITPSNQKRLPSLREEMEDALDGLLCSCNERPQKDGEGAARCPSCSQNAHDETVLVRCAQ